MICLLYFHDSSLYLFDGGWAKCDWWRGLRYYGNFRRISWIIGPGKAHIVRRPVMTVWSKWHFVIEFSEGCFTMGPREGCLVMELGEGSFAKDKFLKGQCWWISIINIRVHCNNFIKYIFTREILGRDWDNYSSSFIFLVDSSWVFCIRSLRVAIEKAFIVCVILSTSNWCCLWE